MSHLTHLLSPSDLECSLGVVLATILLHRVSSSSIRPSSIVSSHDSAYDFEERTEYVSEYTSLLDWMIELLPAALRDYLNIYTIESNLDMNGM